MKKSITYLGFAGHGNLGDDAIFEVYQRLLPTYSLWRMPVRKADVLRVAAAGQLIEHRRAPMLLGGGTVLGRTIWRHHIRRTRLLVNPKTSTMLGAGVEDPDFCGDGRYTSREELARWHPILEQFDSITVRGPRSREILESVDIDARIVGDPALLLAEADLTPRVNTGGPILVNLTHGEDQWGGKSLDWSPHVIRVLADLIRIGHTIEFVSMEPEDVPKNNAAIAQLGGSSRHHSPASTDELIDLLRGAQLVIGTRLHTCVLAVAVGVPTVSLEYRPKCRDFMASVAADRFCHRVDRLEGDGLRDSVDELLQNGLDQLKVQNRRVGELRVLLLDELKRLSASLGGPLG